MAAKLLVVPRPSLVAPVRKGRAPSAIDTTFATRASSASSSASPSASSSPSRKPLVFKKPTRHQFTWSELQTMVASKDLTPMGRSEAVQEAYQRAIKRRTIKYGSPDEYIRQRILHWPASSTPSSPSTRDSCSTPASANVSESESCFSDGNESSGSLSPYRSPPLSPTGPVDPLEVALKKNEFPYSVKPGIEHWLIWSRHPLTDEVWIRRYLEERLPGRDFMFFINPPELRSVPSIFHVQVFTKGEGVVLDEEDMELKKQQEEGQQQQQQQQQQ
ncbi:hypothetical protein BGW38_004267 [Lunasporangiospora selenospora]|uniref:Uncharacterized protein n=1 Tax=Lunasporangiospora selenospora TaxID=979761 RepID=A0A9P6G0Y7_9FUNG|nr:hypothetical protein BGW38_004267 [Lunasporangiospora selenospora]